MKQKNIKKALALAYSAESGKPDRPVAAGRGSRAARIAEKALASGVPLRSAGQSLALLNKLDFIDQVPDELFAAVSEIAAYILGKESKLRESKNA